MSKRGFKAISDFKAKSKAGYAYNPCHLSHKELALGGGRILGASCLNPREGYDVYVGLDDGIHYLHNQYPWNPPSEVVEFLFTIQDYHAPRDSTIREFKNMIRWLSQQLIDGKKVHIGCIGGHGRTGTVLAALYNHITRDPDAIGWVRANYCDSAVESYDQIDFLSKTFDINRVQPSRAYGGFPSYGSYGGAQHSSSFGNHADPSKGCYTYNPVYCQSNVFGLGEELDAEGAEVDFEEEVSEV